MRLAIIVFIVLSAIAIFGVEWDESKRKAPPSWRWALRKRRIQRWFAYQAWRQYLPNLRWLTLLLVAVFTYFAVRYFLPDFQLNNISKLEHAADATVFLAFIGAPIAYVVWWFRDTNNREQIENQRKDINLKDFQRLAEWAAGMHLPEDKVSTANKTSKPAGEDTKAGSTESKSSTSHETSTLTETTKPPEHSAIHTPSRREGAASLQIAAIYQLQAFLQGAYGKYFQRPAFQLLKSIWLALVNQHLAELNKIMETPRDFAIGEDEQNFKEALEEWRKQLTATMNSSIGQAITVALGAQQGWLLRTHQEDLPNEVLTGYNSWLAALQQPLELDGLNLSGIQLQGAGLSGAQLQGADLRGAQLQVAYLYGARLQGASLSRAQLQGASLSRAQLQGASLSRAQLQGAILSQAQLQGANLSQAKLQGTRLINIETDDHTLFDFAETDSATQVFEESGSFGINFPETLY